MTETYRTESLDHPMTIEDAERINEIEQNCTVPAKALCKYIKSLVPWAGSDGSIIMAPPGYDPSLYQEAEARRVIIIMPDGFTLFGVMGPKDLPDLDQVPS